MAGKRARQPDNTIPSKSPMEESADALAGVEGALTGSKRKGTTAPSKKLGGGGATTTSTANAAEGDAVNMPRSNSMEQLAEVAGSILKEEEEQDQDRDDKRVGAGAWYATNDIAIAAAAAAAAATVPNPMADAAATAAAVPTGFRKKPAAKKATIPAKSAAASSSSEPSAAPPETATSDDGNGKSRKTQITYNPDVAMTKEQLTAWRREMRRVRNRESAAASRRKVRDRIDELEDEVEIWKRRYQEVMARLGQSEGDREEEEREVRRELNSSETTAMAIDDEGKAHSQV
ncbi:hypothetical protein ACHAXA_011339 [Cyclostephanos tholiformis]|uniref:BZIP domain-containing protein n=1 Tax=Cyclostephanos tholiformis TaxID=382380 RepID=A0ABD3REE0_9STRA